MVEQPDKQNNIKIKEEMFVYTTGEKGIVCLLCNSSNGCVCTILAWHFIAIILNDSCPESWVLPLPGIGTYMTG
jgi:hypothetical protein